MLSTVNLTVSLFPTNRMGCSGMTLIEFKARTESWPEPAGDRTGQEF